MLEKYRKTKDGKSDQWYGPWLRKGKRNLKNHRKKDQWDLLGGLNGIWDTNKREEIKKTPKFSFRGLRKQLKRESPLEWDGRTEWEITGGKC